MEGPSLVILKEELRPFLGQKIIKISGNSKQPIAQLQGRHLVQIFTWGKVLFMKFDSVKNTEKPVFTKTHFMMFGSYRINDPKENRVPRVEFTFKSGKLYFYSCSFKMDAEAYMKNLDRKVDLLSKKWDAKHVLKLMQKKKKSYLCDLFLDQSLFAGSGNIVKNEVLFNIRRHPLTRLEQIDKKYWPHLIQAVQTYCAHFYNWKKKFELRQHWQVYRQHNCPLCRAPLRKEITGKMNRKSFFCLKHQPVRAKSEKLIVHSVLPVKTPPAKEARFDH